VFNLLKSLDSLTPQLGDARSMAVLSSASKVNPPAIIDSSQRFMVIRLTVSS